MSVQIHEKNGLAYMKIDGALNVYEAAKIHEKMNGIFEKHDGLIIDISGLEECDLTGLQILISARQTAREKGKKFVLENVTRVVVDACSRVGLLSGEMAT